LIGSFGWFFMWFLLFIRQLPVMAMSEIKEIVPPQMRHPHSEIELERDLTEGTVYPDDTGATH